MIRTIVTDKQFKAEVVRLCDCIHTVPVCVL